MIKWLKFQLMVWRENRRMARTMFGHRVVHAYTPRNVEPKTMVAFVRLPYTNRSDSDEFVYISNEGSVCVQEFQK